MFEEASQAFAEVKNMEREIEEINEALSHRTDYESDEYMALIEKVSSLSERFYSIEERNYDADIEKTLFGSAFFVATLPTTPMSSPVDGACVSN